jgi:hypothetical protein
MHSSRLCHLLLRGHRGSHHWGELLRSRVSRKAKRTVGGVRAFSSHILLLDRCRQIDIQLYIVNQILV